jgi:hypothetical protein
MKGKDKETEAEGDKGRRKRRKELKKRRIVEGERNEGFVYLFPRNRTRHPTF